MYALIFGAGGQDGFYLSKLCEAQGITPIGISRTGEWTKGDVSNFGEVQQLIKTYLPEYIFHLAAESSTRHDALFINHETISTGTINILESVYRYSPQSKVFLTGSGVQFQNEGFPISEIDKFEPVSPYAVARIQSVYAARYYRTLGIQTYVGYLFHHESPLRKPQHVSQRIVQAVKRIANGTDELIDIGDLSVAKEWTFAGDVVRGIFTLVEQQNVFEATIGSGITYTIQDWIKECFNVVGNERWSDFVRVIPGFVPEYYKLVSNPSTIKSLGWEPTISFKKLASMMMQNGVGTNG